MRFTLKESKSASPTLAAIAEKLTHRKPLHAAMGKRVEGELRAHFLQRNEEPNKRGWPSQNFWSQVRRATAYQGADETAARVVISDPRIAQKIHGGTIRPVERKFLALAAIAEAYGHAPREFNFLHVVRFKGSGALALVEADRNFISVGKQRKDGSRRVKDKGQAQRGRVWFWLAKKVTQKADANALPGEQHLQDAMLDEAQQFMERQ
jgi:hypothetical protein